MSFGKHIGAQLMERIFRMSVGFYGELALEDVVHVNTTVQEESIRYPTESELTIKIIASTRLPNPMVFLLRRTFIKEVKLQRWIFGTTGT